MERGADCLPLHPKPHHLLPHLNQDWIYLSDSLTQVVLEKRPLNGCSSNSSSNVMTNVISFCVR